MTDRPLRIAVVGHTNTGKTSLLRTLTRDSTFGEVSSRPSTTRHVEGAQLLADGRVLIELFDTPGLEDSIALLEHVEALAGSARLDGPARIERFLASPAAGTRFEQEAKVLRQLRDSDAGFYVIDARDPVLAKHRDELALLAACAIPMLPVLNFVRSQDADETAWREALSRAGLHAVVRFDSVAPEADAERRLYEALGTLLDQHRQPLQAFVALRERDARLRRQAAARRVAEMLIDVAAARDSAPADSPQQAQAAVRRLGDLVRAREQRCVDELLGLYRFSAADLAATALPMLDGRWTTDLFSPEALRQAGLRVGGGAAAGAAAGVAIDLMVGGLTLGAAAAIGALAGGGWQTLRHYGNRLRGRLSGRLELTIEDSIIGLLAVRELTLVAALEARGHAAVEPMALPPDTKAAWLDKRLPAPLELARTHPEWSSLLAEPDHATGRDEAIEALSRWLEPLNAVDTG